MADTANLKIVWNGDSKGNGSLKAGNLETNVAIPESLGGSGEGAGPKELLISSAASCFTLTLVAMLEARKLPVSGLTVDSESSLSKEEGLKITHYPHITMSAEATEEQVQAAQRTFVSADKACAVGNLLKAANAQIDIEGKVTVQN
ncbi:OsmC family protein [Cytobacillus gottheilii]|uniref:OsmC family protein n=1 Tax=Cytobacillus gottheilii TaxID=859144 RepID=UPI0009B93969|nr:OsmC family protein [Cytobacillus gottheilii]